MLSRREIFPHVIEINYQARRRLGCCVYLVFGGDEWMLIDIGYEETVADIVELIRQMDFPLSNCRYLVATHADVDHIQGLKSAQKLLPAAETVGHAETQRLLARADRVTTFAEITAQNISMDLPAIQIDRVIDEGDTLSVGDMELTVWHTPGHTHGQLAFRMGELLFSGDNIYRDGCVGNIDAHHGSDISDFIRSLERIRNSEITWLLPSHGPFFRKDTALIQSAIDRLTQYQHMADFGTCAIDWPLLDEWEQALARGGNPPETKH